MSKEEVREIAREIAREVVRELHGDKCPMGWTQEDAQALREFAQSLRAAKATAMTTLIGILIAGAVGMTLYGFWARVRAFCNGKV